MVSMPQEKFIALLPDLLDEEKIEKAVPDIMDAVKRKEMTMEGFLVVTTKNGQRAVGESTKEVRYPTEEIPVSPDSSANDSGTGDAASGSAAPAPSAAPVPSATPVPSAAPSPTPVLDFEIRNTGVVLEVEPLVSEDRQSIDLNLMPMHTQLLGFINPLNPGKEEVLLKENEKTETSQPVFYVMKDTTSVTLRSGHHLLLGVHKTAQDGVIEIFIVHAEVLGDK